MNQLHVTGKEKIGKYQFVGIEGGFGEGKKAMTVKDIAGIHNQAQGEINRRINNSRNRFKDGIDIIDLKSVMGLSHSEIAQFGFTQNAFNASKNIYILSERGYAKLLKILEDDTAWEIYDQLVDNYFSYRKAVQSIGSDMSDLDVRRVNATARLENARVRKAKLLSELSKDADSKVNKILLQEKAAEILTGEKLLEMPVLKQKMFDSESIAKKLGIYSKSGEPHTTAVSQLIQQNIILNEDEAEIVPFFDGRKSGTMVNYAESVIEKVENWLIKHSYPTVIKGKNMNYHIVYED